jgi:DNA-binding transcriptional regulator YdaS (Cro superfamily)
MTLSEYIAENHGGNVSAFARRLGKRPTTVRRWLLPLGHQDRRDPRGEAEAIYAATEGRVTPNDLLLAPASEERAA